MISCVPYKLCKLDKSKFYVAIVVRLCDLGSPVDVILYKYIKYKKSKFIIAYRKFKT